MAKESSLKITEILKKESGTSGRKKQQWKEKRHR